MAHFGGIQLPHNAPPVKRRMPIGEMVTIDIPTGYPSVYINVGQEHGYHLYLEVNFRTIPVKLGGKHTHMA